MASKTFAELAVQTSVADGDLFATYRGSGPLKQLDAVYLAPYVATGLGGTTGHKFGYLDVANTFSALQTVSLGTATTALDYIALKPTDYGTGKPGFFISKLATATSWQVQLYDGTNSAGQVDLKLTLLNLTGALTISGVLTAGTGIILTGSTKQNVVALAALDFDLATSDFFTKSISANSVFTFSNPTASKAQAFIVRLTISSSAVPTWPASVKWQNSAVPTFANGNHMVGFLTVDGGTTWVGIVGALAYG